MKYVKNAHYWQHGLPKIDTVYYPAYTSNDPANQDLASGAAQWGSQFIPSIKAFYLSKSKDNHYWFPPVSNVSVFINLKNALLKNVAIRQAMAYAIDRSRVSQIGEYGYEPAANQTGIVTPTFKSWLNPSLAKKFSYNPTKAKQILTKAGYKMKGGVFQTKGGQAALVHDDQHRRLLRLGRLGADRPAGAEGRRDQGHAVEPLEHDVRRRRLRRQVRSHVRRQRSRRAGAVLRVAPGALLEELRADRQDGLVELGALLQQEGGQLIEAYAATTSSAKQHQIVNQLEAAMVRDVPIIPITEGVDWYQYNTEHLAGWVTQKNPFAKPAAYEVPDWGVMLLHLKPKG